MPPSPGKKYKEKLQDVWAIQNTGSNLADLQAFAPGLVTVEQGVVMLMTPVGNVPVPTNDWLMDDPTIGFVSPLTDEAFNTRFTNQAAKPAPDKRASDKWSEEEIATS